MEIPCLEPLVQESNLESLLRTPGVIAFVKESYRTLLLREPDAGSLMRSAWRLRFLPFYTRRRFLRKLLDSDEHMRVLENRLRLIEQTRLSIEQQREALASHCRELASAEQAFELQRQLQEKQKVEGASERRHWQAIEAVVLSKRESLLNIENFDSFVQNAYQEVVGRQPTQAELCTDGKQLQAGLDRAKRNLLHELMASHCLIDQAEITETTGGPEPIHQKLRPKPVKGSACRVCDGPLSYKWSLPVLLDKYVADYYECQRCRALQIPDPYWLDEAYESENTSWMCNPDTGRFMRNFSTFRYLAALHKAQVFAEHPHYLDFAGGYGLLTQMLHNANYQAWLTDMYVSTPFFASDRYIRDFDAIPEKTFDVITALEVFEHLTDPYQIVHRLGKILKPNGTLVLSTSIYQPEVHDSNWAYLGPQWGQHVTFWSKEALEACAGRTGFRSVSYFPGDEGVLVLFSNHTALELRPKLERALALLHDVHHFRESLILWDCLTREYFKALPEPVIREVHPSTEPQNIAA